MAKLRVATFTRGSTTKQTSRGKLKKASQTAKQSSREITVDDDLPLQKELIRQFIATQPEKNKGIEWVITDLEYVEAGVSGFHTHVSKRKGLNQAFDDARAGLYDILVIYKLDRFGRRSVESLNHAIKFLKFCRIWVVDKSREFTNNGDADEIMNFIEFWSAKKASMDTKIRVTDAMRVIHEGGYWTGGNPPYGYINHPEISNMLQIVPAEADVVRQIYHMYTIDGFGMLRIAGILNENGKKTKLGLAWKSENIRKILRNTVYKGYLSYGKSRTTEGEFGSYQKYMKQGEETVSSKYWSEFDIVGEEVWEKAQSMKKARVKTDNLFGKKTPSRAGTGRGLLVGIMKCECGSPMTHGTAQNWLDHKRTKKGLPYGIYRCLSRLKGGVAACRAEKGMYKSQEVESIVIEAIKVHIGSLLTGGTVDDIKKKAFQANKDIAVKLELIKKEIDRWLRAKENANAELAKLLMGEDSTFDKEQLAEVYKKAVTELDNVTREYAVLEALVKNEGASDVDILRLQDLLNNWDDYFNGATVEIKRQMVGAVISEVALKGKEIKVEIAFDVARYLESISTSQGDAAYLQYENNWRTHSSRCGYAG